MKRKENNACDIRMPQYCDDTGCTHISEYIKYGTGCPILRQKKEWNTKMHVGGGLRTVLPVSISVSFAGICFWITRMPAEVSSMIRQRRAEAP